MLISIHHPHTRKKEARSHSVCIRAPQAAYATARSPLLLVPASLPLCLPRSSPVFSKPFWGDTQSSFCSAKCLARPGKRSTFKENQAAPPHQPSFPACVAGGRERHWWAVGRATSPGSQRQNRRHLRRVGGSPGSGGRWGRERSSFMARGWQGCEQGPPAPSRQLARSAVFAGSVKRTRFMGDIYHYPVLLKYSLCSRLELVRLLSSQVGG